MAKRAFILLFSCASLFSIHVGAEDDITFETGLTAFQKGNYLESFYIWKTLAGEDDPLSSYNLGVLYANGLGTEQDAVRALVLYRQSAEAGYAPAQFNLGMAYLRGEGVNVDYKAAARWWLKAAEQKNIQATFNLATLYMKGLGVEKDETIARGLYKLSADLGDVRSARMLAELDKQDRAGAGEPAATMTGDEIESWIEKQPTENYTVQVFAMRDEALALDNIVKRGLVHEIALFRVRSDGEDWYKALYRSFEQREDAIQARDEMKRIFPEQSPWLRTFGDVRRETKGEPGQGAAGEKHTLPKRQISTEQINGELRRGQSAFIDQQYGDAFDSWWPLAQIDVAEAQYGLGFMYESGWGVEQDFAKAFHWYERAANLGHAKSQYNLGMLYLTGLGVGLDLNKGHHWISAAADQNDARALSYFETMQLRKK